MKNSIRAAVSMRDEAQGGRHAPFTAGYCPHLVVGDGLLLGVRVAEAPSPVFPGTDAIVSFELLYPDNVDYSALEPGASFNIIEGPNIVGSGVVVGA